MNELSMNLTPMGFLILIRTLQVVRQFENRLRSFHKKRKQSNVGIKAQHQNESLLPSKTTEWQDDLDNIRSCRLHVVSSHSHQHRQDHTLATVKEGHCWERKPGHALWAFFPPITELWSGKYIHRYICMYAYVYIRFTIFVDFAPINVLNLSLSV